VREALHYGAGCRLSSCADAIQKQTRYVTRRCRLPKSPWRGGRLVGFAKRVRASAACVEVVMLAWSDPKEY
jgi:hypothetical protein